MLLNAFAAIAFSPIRFAPFVSFFLISCIPLAIYLAYSKPRRKVFSYAILFVCLTPTYVASFGPAIAVADFLLPESPTRPMWPHNVVKFCYPLHNLLDDTTIFGKAMIEYCDQWGAAVGCTRYSSVFEKDEIGPWLWWVEQI